MTHDYKKKKVKGNGYNHIWTEDKLNELGDALIDWAANSKDIHLSKFTIKYKRPKRWLYDIARKHPLFAEKFDLAREMMSAKIANACFRDSDVNASFGEKYLPVWDQEYKDLIAWKEEIKKKEISEKEANLIIKAMNFANDVNDKSNCNDKNDHSSSSV